MTIRRLTKRVDHVDRVAATRWVPRVQRTTLDWKVLTEIEQVALKHILRQIKAVTIQGLTGLELECTACLRERMDGSRIDPCDVAEIVHA